MARLDLDLAAAHACTGTAAAVEVESHRRGADRWPHVDKELRARLLRALRARQRRAAASLSPAERIARLLDMSAFARRASSRDPRTARSTDESTELLSEIKTRLRRADGRG